MKATLRAKPQFYLWLSEAEIAMLMLCSSFHYDSRCKAAGQQGGFIYGWDINRLYIGPDPDNGLISCTADFGQLDTCLKILEMPRPEDREVAWNISNNLHLLLNSSSQLVSTLEWEIIK